MLPDYLAPNLEIVFVGLNPGTYSDRVGHYFARSTNLFWTALYESGLIREPLTPQDDARMPSFGYGLTDLVARATANVDALYPSEFVSGGAALRRRLEPLAPRIVCFIGLVGYRAAYDRHASPGVQSPRWGETYLYIVPSTSPRNAYYRPQVINWFKQLQQFRISLALLTPGARASNPSGVSSEES